LEVVRMRASKNSRRFGQADRGEIAVSVKLSQFGLQDFSGGPRAQLRDQPARFL